MEPKHECQCDHCRSACEHQPGWFLPGEVEVLAKALGITVQELFDKHLIVDRWLEFDKEDTLVLMPRPLDYDGGDYFHAFITKHVCHWYVDGKCQVHTLGKPAECAALGHEPEDFLSHLYIKTAWDKHQDFIHKLIEEKERRDVNPIQPRTDRS